MVEIINLFPAIIFIVYLFYNIKKIKRIISMSNFIISLFTLSMICFFVCSSIEIAYYYTFEALLYIFIPTFIILLPLSEFERQLVSNSKIIRLNNNGYRIISYILISVGMYSIAFFVFNLEKVLSSGLEAQAIREYIVNFGNFYESSILSKIAVFGAFVSPIALFLYFYTIIINENKWIRRLLIISSTSFVFYTLNVAGRDGIAIWCISYLALICLFYPLLSHKEKLNQMYLLCFIIVCSGPIFIIISMQRFGIASNSENGFWFSIADYLGQQLFELSSRIDKLKVINYTGEPRLIWPLLVDIGDIFSKFSTIVEKSNRYELRSHSLDVGLDTYRFVYYVGDFLTELGNRGLILCTVLIYFVCRTNLKITNNGIIISRLLISFSWYMIIAIGVFYFYYGELAGNVILIFPFVLKYFLQFSERKQISIVSMNSAKEKGDG